MLKKMTSRACYILIYITFIYSSTGCAQKQQPSADQWVASQEKIRVFIDSTPNYGNQTASLNVISQLRQMGFKGTFEIIYNDVDGNGYEPVKPKVIKLLALPMDIPDDYTIQHPLFGNLHLLSAASIYQQVKANPDHPVLENMALAIDGGDEFGVAQLEKQIDNSTTLQVNVGPYVQYASSIKDIKTHRWQEIPNSQNKFYNFPVFSFKDAEQFLLTDPEGIALAQKKPALKILLEGIKQQNFFMMPMYGTSIKSEDDIFLNLHNVLRIIAAVRYAQLKESTLQTKPIILGVFYDYRREMAILKSLLQNNQWGKYEKPGSATARTVLHELKIAETLQFASMSDEDVSDRIRALKPGQLLMLSLEPLPKVVFDGLYNHADTNMLPPIREGANTLNTLVLTGRSHFRCGGGTRPWELGYDYLMTDENFKNTFKEVTDYLCSLDEDSADWEGVDKSHWLTHKDLYRQLGDLMIQTRNPTSTISQYFARLQIEAHKPENDRVRYALGEALKQLQE